ncbi:MAG TPA: ABC transporter ATP-binding protein, partial [Gemmatimonadaceae bacterium]|nr:ABC transporter ATP-binding protein [Gemmatimonadaceae bacterium]
MIAFSDLVVRYPGAASNAVDGVSFVSERGSLTALAGPNGSGKSSIVRALLRRAETPGGSASIDGKDVRSLSYSELARKVAVVPQREETAFPIRVNDYVSLGRYPHLGLWSAPGASDRAAVAEA